jgi:hypothetical protein
MSVTSRQISQTAFFRGLSMYVVGDYTLAPYKVCWPELSNNLRVGVVESAQKSQIKNKILVPDHTVIFIPLKNRDEAHYCSAVLNSSIAGLIVASYITMHPSPHILEHVRLLKFDAHNKQHCRLAESVDSIFDFHSRTSCFGSRRWCL